VSFAAVLNDASRRGRGGRRGRCAGKPPHRVTSAFQKLFFVSAHRPRGAARHARRRCVRDRDRDRDALLRPRGTEGTRATKRKRGRRRVLKSDFVSLGARAAAVAIPFRRPARRARLTTVSRSMPSAFSTIVNGGDFERGGKEERERRRGLLKSWSVVWVVGGVSRFDCTKRRVLSKNFATGRRRGREEGSALSDRLETQCFSRKRRLFFAHSSARAPIPFPTTAQCRQMHAHTFQPLARRE
jgi:hypothetical protein